MADIRAASSDDVSQILAFIRELAEFEREPDAVVATEASLHHALFFHNFSTWEGKKGLYLEDLYITPDARGQGVGTQLLQHLARIAIALASSGGCLTGTRTRSTSTARSVRSAWMNGPSSA